jgi:glycosyltransferase involved in cell wall biosynthesis
MRYIVAVQASAYPISETEFAVESAFADHLRELRHSIGPRFERIVLVAPTLTKEMFGEQEAHLGRVSGMRDGIYLLPAHPENASTFQFWFGHAARIVRQLRTHLKSGGVVHSGMSTDIWRPLMWLVDLTGYFSRRPVVFFVDIDFRLHSQRLYRLGIWSRKSYLVNRILHDPLKLFQVWLAPKIFNLVLFKSASMVRDFGGGRENVRNFFDTAHAASQIIDATILAARTAYVARNKPLRLVYFGRLVLNKGVDRMIGAVAHARELSADVRFTIIGDGPCRTELEDQAYALGVGDIVRFQPQVRYGTPLFDLLRDADASLAAPLMEDTPRSAFDSLAAGLPIVAFDISYFRDLADASGAVSLAEWPSTEALGSRIAELAHDRPKVQQMMERSVAFAADNTQEIWLARRAAWMQRYALGETTDHGDSPKTQVFHPAHIA